MRKYLTFRKMPLMETSGITVLFSFNIELINILNHVISIPIMFVVAFSHFNFVIAQIIVCLHFALACILAVIFLAITIYKLLLVTHFSWIFSLDPIKLGKIIKVIAIAVGIIPCAAITLYQTVKGQMGNMAAYLAGINYISQGINILLVYLIFWTLLGFFTLIFTLIYIPHYLKRQRTSQSIQTGEADVPKKEVNLKRISLGLFGALFHLLMSGVGNYTGFYQNLPLNAYSSTTTLNFMLGYFALDDRMFTYIKRKLVKRLPGLRSKMVSAQPYHVQV